MTIQLTLSASILQVKVTGKITLGLATVTVEPQRRFNRDIRRCMTVDRLRGQVWFT